MKVKFKYFAFRPIFLYKGLYYPKTDAAEFASTLNQEHVISISDSMGSITVWYWE